MAARNLDGPLTDIPENVSRDELIRWAAQPGQYNLFPGNPVRLQSCGTNIQGQIYSNNGSHTEDLRSIRSAYVQQVESFKARRHENLRALRQQKSHKSVRMAFYQWNAEFLTPNAFEIVYPFIPGRAERPDVDEVEAIFVTVQDNNGRSKSEHRRFMRKVTGALNALSDIPSCSIVDSTFNELSNIVGTKPTAQGPVANRQVTYMFARDGIVNPGSTHKCSWSFHVRKKEFVGISTACVGIGRLLVLGIHLPTLKEGQSHFVRLLLQHAASKCIPDDYDSESLNYFNAGVYMAILCNSCDT
ncbi:hypothetical protein TGARI_258220 [Toxoplasma gondii ARI]|uniref:Uncharacterized protein n=1 Tax=Toxoplasma gondii ARI TaxID=1074872 RepID=A0A139XSF8_TOXGO|nr:hypothetical protein TGARI_258220 [Toxoplasma gondii ARI]